MGAPNFLIFYYFYYLPILKETIKIIKNLKKSELPFFLFLLIICQF